MHQTNLTGWTFIKNYPANYLLSIHYLINAYKRPRRYEVLFRPLFITTINPESRDSIRRSTCGYFIFILNF